MRNNPICHESHCKFAYNAPFHQLAVALEPVACGNFDGNNYSKISMCQRKSRELLLPPFHDESSTKPHKTPI